MVEGEDEMTVALVITVSGEDRDLHGTVGRPGEAPATFSGWLDMLRQIEARIHARAPGTGSEGHRPT
jgi:hypothetical protein